MRLDSVQALRAVAALGVLVFHLYEQQRLVVEASLERVAAQAEMGLIAGLWANGYSGVDLFFVISGFIMIFITADTPPGRDSVWQFVKSRVRRIYPLWWVFCLLLMAYYWIQFGSPFDQGQILGGADPVAYLVNSFLLIPQESFPIYGQGWTLVHEMYFYFVFAALLFLPRRIRYWGLAGWAVTTAGFVMAGFAAPRAQNYLGLIGSMHTFQFLAGAVVGMLLVHRRIVMPRTMLAIGVGLTLLALSFYSDGHAHLMTYGRIFVYTLPFALVIYGLVGLEMQNGLRVPAWIVRVGDWSYSLYLCHSLVLTVIVRALPTIRSWMPEPVAALLEIGTPGPWDNLTFALIGTVASLACAAIFYVLVERPFSKLLRRTRQISP